MGDAGANAGNFRRHLGRKQLDCEIAALAILVRSRGGQ